MWQDREFFALMHVFPTEIGFYDFVADGMGAVFLVIFPVDSIHRPWWNSIRI